jgi:hypothetical protein
LPSGFPTSPQCVLYASPISSSFIWSP